ncbi:LAG1 longevity assurance-like [Heracleum sosnowskyi]|uniref:LAG1 longevity assurance-like n=1 Tax=Heracleum sosnowskyi TaxID=360622 RepID=A0AAD8JE75_9APIA|nr:LAG1 longevity assurance-like [Heracleum sosnowskyi]
MDSNTINADVCSWHLIFALLLAFVFLFLRFVLNRFIFRRLSIWLLSTKSTFLKNDESSRAKIEKCMESMWKLTYYGTAEFCILKAINQETWFRNTEDYFKGWPNQELTLPVKLYYMCQCGFYLYSIGALVKWETRRKDFSVMMSHHIITVILISYSYITRFFRIGSVVLALHDASDVFMEAAKIFKYSENELGASVLFGFFAISWLVTRLIFFPFWVIHASSYHLAKVLRLSEAYHTLEKIYDLIRKMISWMDLHLLNCSSGDILSHQRITFDLIVGN